MDVVTRAVAKLNINWLAECHVELRGKLDESRPGHAKGVPKASTDVSFP